MESDRRLMELEAFKQQALEKVQYLPVCYGSLQVLYEIAVIFGNHGGMVCGKSSLMRIAVSN